VGIIGRARMKHCATSSNLKPYQTKSIKMLIIALATHIKYIKNIVDFDIHPTLKLGRMSCVRVEELALPDIKQIEERKKK